LQRAEIVEFHYITPISNLPSIFEHGILSNARADRLAHDSVASEEVQTRRQKQVPGGRRLHEYVNLYFHARNPMLFKRRGLRDSLCVLRVSPDVLDIPGTVVTDGNAASNYIRFAPAPHGVAIVTRDLAFAEWWTDGDEILQWRKKVARCAEVLVPDRVPPDLILGAYVSGTVGRERCEASGASCEITIDSRMFFL
jgi:hypothetical protein